MTAPFIGLADLGDYMQRDDIDEALGTIACDAACDAVRTYTGRTLNEVADDNVLLDGTGTSVLMLPDWDVQSVSAVFVDDVEVTDYLLGAAGLLYRGAADVWPSGPLRVRVIFSHGSADIRSIVRLVALQCAARIYAAGGVANDAPPIGHLLPLERGALDTFRDRGYRPPVWREPASDSSSSSSA